MDPIKFKLQILKDVDTYDALMPSHNTNMATNMPWVQQGHSLHIKMKHWPDDGISCCWCVGPVGPTLIWDWTWSLGFLVDGPKIPQEPRCSHLGNILMSENL